jgi:hypothetical protein
MEQLQATLAAVWARIEQVLDWLDSKGAKVLSSSRVIRKAQQDLATIWRQNEPSSLGENARKTSPGPGPGPAESGPGPAESGPVTAN